MERSKALRRSLFFWGVEISLEALRTLLFFGIVAILMRFFVVQPFVVIGESMKPAFADKEYLLIDKLSYRLRNPKRGEVIILRPPSSPKETYIKRIIGLPGEKIEIEGNIIKINGQHLLEPYLSNIDSSETDQELKTILGPNEFFVLGDNRLHSSDSREIGPIPRINLVGRAAVAVVPLAKAGFIFPPQYGF